MSPPRLLLIEDDPDIAQATTYDLEDAGYTVEVAASVMTGLVRLREAEPDLLLLDLGLPDADGSVVVSRLRKSTTVPIIVLTARDTLEEKVRLLTLGADDYLVKPCDVRELVARIRVQLRPHHEAPLVLGELEVFPLQRQAFYQGQDLQLSPKEFELLFLLAREPGRIYTRPQIMEALWQGTLPAASNVVDVHMANLRSKLRDHGGYRVLRTVRHVGYAVWEKSS